MSPAEDVLLLRNGVYVALHGDAPPGLIPRAHRPTFLTQHPRQSEVGKDAAVCEPRYGGDLVALNGEDEQ
jgi:hypothetical protein